MLPPDVKVLVGNTHEYRASFSVCAYSYAWELAGTPSPLVLILQALRGRLT